jgi:hypothetical protein
VSRAGRAADGTARALASLATAQTLYLLTLGLAAPLRLRAPRPADEALHLAVLVPAHDERLTIVSAVESLLASAYPTDAREVLVLADNCRDETAELARIAGATVWQREDLQRPGKGEVVSWALSRLREERPGIDAVVMMDADCVAEPGLLRGLAGELAAGADVVQGAYLASNPDASQTAALRWAGYALMNVVRPAGKDALGLSCGLMGSGMAFGASTLDAVPWAAFSVTEDKEQHLRLLEAGMRVRFAPGAVVRSPMPAAQSRAETQQVRWETGNLGLARRWVPRLLHRAARHGDPGAAHAAWELLVPPLSLLAAAQLGLGALGRLTRRPLIVRRANVGLAGLGAYVAIGLLVTRAPVSVYRALLGSPRLIVRRLAQYAAIARGRGHREWQRTRRD